MLTRLCGVSNGHLVAVEARYHRKGFLSNYVNRRNIAAKLNTLKSQEYQATVARLIAEFRDSITDTNAYLLTTLKARFQELYTSHNLKKWSDVAFIPRPGLTNLARTYQCMMH